MDGIYLSGTLDPARLGRSSQNISIRGCEFRACHRNGISVIDADDVEIVRNTFRDIVGEPGAGVDIEPDFPQQHGNRIEVRENIVEDCSRGLSISLQFGGPQSANSQGEKFIGNTIMRTLAGFGILVLGSESGALVWGNAILDPAGHGVEIISSSRSEFANNLVVNPGHCNTPGVCTNVPTFAGIQVNQIRLRNRSSTPTENKIQGNIILDYQHAPTLLYGIDFASTALRNIIRQNIILGFDPARGIAIHAPNAVAARNVIQENTGQ